MIDLQEVGSHPTKSPSGDWEIRFGIYLPEITFNRGYRLKVRVIHEQDQFVRGIEPLDFDLFWHNGHPLDLWDVTVRIADHVGHGSFGAEGSYLYRFQLFRGSTIVAMWFSDPFARTSGIGTHSAVTVDSSASTFIWNDHAFRIPEVDDMVVYELHVGEFNSTFDGVTAQLDYLWELGVNVLELLPVTNVREDVEWGYTPLGYFAPDERFGGNVGMKRLVNACHQRGIAVILDAVYAHAHPEFAYNFVYEVTGERNPMMGPFEGEFFSRPGADYRKEFTRDFFFEVNKFWLAEYHVDGFRYDYVPGFLDGPAGQGYANLVFRTYQHSKPILRCQALGGRSRLIQCAEHLPDPKGILSTTYSNTCWQNGLLDKTDQLAQHRFVDEHFAHLLDPEILGYPTEYTNPASGDRFPVAPFQYIETHDHSRLLARFAAQGLTDLLGVPYGDRSQFFRLQPFVIALYAAKGIPMLWQGQEFGENWGVPGSGTGRVLFRRDLHWEYFYDQPGRALIRLYRIMGNLRRSSRALASHGFFFYFHDPVQLARGVICFQREAQPDGATPGESMLVFLNFFDTDADCWAPFPHSGAWVELIDQADSARPTIHVDTAGDWHAVNIPAHYGLIYRRQLP